MKTTGQMGFLLKWGVTEVKDQKDEEKDKKALKYLALAISRFSFPTCFELEAGWERE